MARKLTKKEREHMRWLMDRGVDALNLRKMVSRRHRRINWEIVDAAERLVDLLAAEFQGIIVSEPVSQPTD